MDTEIWERHVATEREELEKRKAGHVGRLLGDPLPCESGKDLRRFAEQDRERAERGLMLLRLPLNGLTGEDRPSRLEAKRVLASWISDPYAARPSS